MSADLESQRPIRKRAGQIITVLVSIGVLYFCLHKLSWEELIEAAAGADLIRAWLGMLIPLFFFWITDAAYTVRSFTWFHRPTPFKSYLVIKASAYLLSMINIAFSTGGVFLYFMKKTGISLRKQAGMLLFREAMAVFGATIVMGGLTLYVYVFTPERAEAIGLGLWVPLILALLLIMVEVYVYFSRGRGLLLKNLPVAFTDEFWAAFRMADWRHWLLGMLYTVPAIFIYLLGLFVVARAFHVQVELVDFLFWIPLVALLSAVPVTFSGFGATTAAWMAFFSDSGSAADITVLTLFLPAARLVVRAALGALFMPMAMKEISLLSSESNRDKPSG